MRYTPKEADPVFDTIAPVIQGLGLSLLETIVSRHKGSTQIRVVIYRGGPSGALPNSAIGVDDCSRVHHAILPRLELAFPGEDLYVEVSSPGIDRLIRDGAEFVHYLGRGLRCYRTDISDWTAGILKAADTEKITLQTKGETIDLNLNIIAKAKLDHSIEKTCEKTHAGKYADGPLAEMTGG
ncbi:MAG: ribosome assembly cofactor RimP [Spirochaetaceae bacterium]|nr:ribosome assembly cofactor RimP [Spirochaetaceae bacterium]